MTEKTTALSRSLVVGRKRDGRHCYDPEAKRELVEACLRPGVSVAGMALEHGINANLLPKRWIVERAFAWLSWYRRFSNDFEHSSKSSEAMVCIVSSSIMLRKFYPL